MDSIEYIGDVRALGAMVGVEFVKNKDNKEPYKKYTVEVIARAAKKGLLLMKAGVYDNVIRFLPPIVTPSEVIEKAMDIFEECLKEAKNI